MKASDDGVGGSAMSMRFDWQNIGSYQLSMLYRSAEFNPSTIYQYQRSHEVEISIAKAIKSIFFEVKLNLGEDAIGDQFLRSSFKIRW